MSPRASAVAAGTAVDDPRGRAAVDEPPSSHAAARGAHGRNVLGAFAFTPWGGTVRDLAGMPPGAHPVYLLVIAVFVLLFGVGYLWTGLTGYADPLFIALAAAGKLAFFALLAGFWLAGDLSVRAPASAVGDLVFGTMFVVWLVVDTALAR